MTTRSAAHRQDRAHLAVLIRCVKFEIRQIAIWNNLSLSSPPTRAIGRAVERLRAAMRTAERYSLSTRRSAQGRPTAGQGRERDGMKPHVCQYPRGCRCSVVGLEPEDDCPTHGWPERRCDICGRFLPYPKQADLSRTSQAGNKPA